MTKIAAETVLMMLCMAPFRPLDLRVYDVKVDALCLFKQMFFLLSLRWASVGLIHCLLLPPMKSKLAVLMGRKMMGITPGPWLGHIKTKTVKEEGVDVHNMGIRKSTWWSSYVGCSEGNGAEWVGVRGCGSLPQHPPVPAMRPFFSALPGTSF